MAYERLASRSTRTLEIGDLDLESGHRLDSVRIACRTWGTAKKRAILVCHALTGSADADDWWPGLIGSGRAFDPGRDFVVCTNVLGSCYGSTGPTSAAPATGERYGPAFPRVTIRDMVRAQARALDALGVETVELVTGGSMGGMQALEWAALFPQRVEALAPIAVSARHSPWCIALSEAQRSSIRSDPRFLGGSYDPELGPVDGLRVARMIAICSYRSWHSFEQRFGRNRQEVGRETGDGSGSAESTPEELFQVESYLRYQGEKLIRRFDANSYLTLTRAMDSHDLARDRASSAAEVLATIEQPALVVSVSSDVLYPPIEQSELAAGMPNARLTTIDSPHGHDGFLIETEQLGRQLSTFRAGLRARPTSGG